MVLAASVRSSGLAGPASSSAGPDSSSDSDMKLSGMGGLDEKTGRGRKVRVFEGAIYGIYRIFAVHAKICTEK